MDEKIRKILAVKYNGMKQRCYNPKNKEFKNYGGRGIFVCEEWLLNPNSFFKWAIENGYQKGLTIERNNVNEGYCPENCTWVTMEKQQSNKRSNVFVYVSGEKLTLAEASRRLGIKESTIWMRLHRGSKIDAPKHVNEKPVIRDDGKIFESVKSAAESVGVSDSKVSMVCKGKRKKTGGHSFRYLTKEEAKSALRRMQDG